MEVTILCLIGCLIALSIQLYIKKCINTWNQILHVQRVEFQYKISPEIHTWMQDYCARGSNPGPHSENFVLKLHPLHMLKLISSVDTLLNVELKRECNQTSILLRCINMCSVWSTGTVLLPPCMNLWPNFVLKLHLHVWKLTSNVDALLLMCYMEKETMQLDVQVIGWVICAVFDQLAQ